MPETKKLSPESIGATYQLGTLTKKSGTTAGVIAVFVIGTISLVCLISVLTAKSAQDRVGYMIAAAIVLPFIVLLYTLATLYTKRYRLYTYTDGFAYVDGQTVQAAHWDEVLHISSFYRNKVGTTYTLSLTDGRSITLPPQISYAGTLVKSIKPRVQQREEQNKQEKQREKQQQQADMLEAYEQGQVVSFGQLRVSKEGIYDRDDFLPWSQVDAVPVEPEEIIIVERLGSHYNNRYIPRSAVNDEEICLQLIKQARGK